MKNQTEAEFIKKHAMKWNDEIGKICGDGKKLVYPGWLNLEQMLMSFLRAYKRRMKYPKERRR